jgi:hypothetical protein
LTPLFDERPAPPDEESAVRFLRYSRVTTLRRRAALLLALAYEFGYDRAA